MYLAFAFGLTWIAFFAYIFSGNVWMADGVLSGMDQFVSLGMLLPALAMLLTRWLTKEGRKMVLFCAGNCSSVDLF